jgi:hypothetical protein
MFGTALTLTVTVAVWPGVAALPLPDATPAEAVTFETLVVVSVVCALPLGSVVTTAALNEPLSAVNETGTPGSTFPFVSRTFAVIVLDPPDDDTVAGLAEAVTPPTAADPIAIFTVFDALVVALVPEPELLVVPPAPPEVAVIVAVPDVVPARKFTMTRPPLVSAWDG